MTLADDLDLEEYITAKDDLSGADIKVEIIQFKKYFFFLIFWYVGYMYRGWIDGSTRKEDENY